MVRVLDTYSKQDTKATDGIMDVDSMAAPLEIFLPIELCLAIHTLFCCVCVCVCVRHVHGGAISLKT